MVFDKTGTLTSGHFKIKNLEVFGIDENEVIDMISQIEAYSNHPIAKSLVEELGGQNSKKIIFTRVSEEKGVGMTASDNNGNTYQLGSKFIGISSEENSDTDFSLYLKKNDDLIARIAIEDEIRSHAAELIDTLKKLGIIPVLLSGDRRDKCEAVAKELGIEEVYAEKLPAEKLETIAQIKQKGKTAMVGDGINDAPALTAADVGVSMSDASHIAIQSAEVILLNNDLKAINLMLRIGKHTVLTIKQNLFWAFFYNVVAIPVAALGFLNPMIAALAMAFSDVIVIGNSIRLKTKSV